ncbi:cyclohexanecarboxylate-CoA ligase [Pseudomonas jinjuensis]|uniref:Cyclohexanecarboxylate-CoA ligase n=1 Tax=Pseudomonas jinjuensis TaxID=198616 RepID=A0A1H0H1E0_9PSED|nr:cyclohexanecarboxylate-CoA ligase [Pseudomonas jinjuensis]SDO12751.1 cyclohexanecarboxylate-CoA ligase [Pseudomonas jinjuensis]
MKISTNLQPQRRSAMLASGAWNDRIITDYLDNALAAGADRTALVAYRAGSDERVELSYAELDRRVTRMACGLAALGVEAGEVVSCQLPNWWQMVALHLACVRIGAVLNPLMPIFRERELRFMLAHAQSRVMVIPHSYRGFDYSAMLDGLRGDLPDLRQVLVIGGEDTFEQLLVRRAWEEESDAAALFAARRPGADDVVQLLYTSGTTGEPKGVLHTSNTLFANVRPYAERLHLGGDDVVFMASPMAHQTGFLYGLMMPIYLQCRAVLQDVWDPCFAVRVARAERPTFTMASTPFLADLIEIAPQHPDALSSLRTFLAAGAPIPSALVERAGSVVNTRIVSAWGMTENGAVTTTFPEDPAERAIHSDGTALPHMQVRVVDDHGQPLPAGDEGHLQVRGASLFVGYLKRPELYGVDADGWFETGDLARMDEQGYIRITGRTKDVVIRGGENVPVVEVENLIYKHPAVSAVALVGCPDERLGERVCAYVTLHDGQPAPTLDELTAFLLDQRLSKTYLPEYLEVLDVLPRTPSGKIQKFKLRELARDIRLGVAKRA